MEKTQVIGIGSAFVDYFFEGNTAFLRKHGITAEITEGADQKKLFSDAQKTLPLLAKSVGGASLNTITILAKLGIQTAYNGVLGGFDKDIEKQLKIVSTNNAITNGNISTCACILTHKRKKRTFAWEMNPHDADFFNSIDYSTLESTDIIHVSPFYLDIEKNYKQLVEIIKKINSPRISLTTSMTYASFGLEKLTPLLQKTYILFVNENEIFAMTGEKGKKGSKTLLSYGPEIIVCTLGEKGALITTKEKQFLSSGKNVKNIVDTTGAGDGFAAGFLYGLIAEKPIEICAETGNIIGAKAITDFGLNWLEGIDKTFVENNS